MRASFRSPRHRSQRGGIAILLVLSLLMVLSVGAFSLARSSIREALITGTVFQGSTVRGEADAGLDWSLQWMVPDNRDLAVKGLLPSGPQEFVSAKRYIELSNGSAPSASAMGPAAVILDPWHSKNEVGIKVVGSKAGGQMLTSYGSMSNSYDMSLTFQGIALLPNTTQTGQQLTLQAGRVNLWTLRSDGQLNAAGAYTYTHSREALVSVSPE